MGTIITRDTVKVTVADIVEVIRCRNCRFRFRDRYIQRLRVSGRGTGDGLVRVRLGLRLVGVRWVRVLVDSKDKVEG